MKCGAVRLRNMDVMKDGYKKVGALLNVNMETDGASELDREEDK